MSAPDEFMQEINALKVPAPLLGKVMHLWASLPRGEWDDFDRKLERVVELVAKEHCGDDGPMLAMAAALRLMALDGLVLDPEFRGWLITEHSPEGITYIHGDLLRIAAEQAVLEGPDGEPTFDWNSFRTSLMELTATRGAPNRGILLLPDDCLRRVRPIAAHSGDGPLSDPSARA